MPAEPRKLYPFLRKIERQKRRSLTHVKGWQRRRVGLGRDVEASKEVAKLYREKNKELYLAYRRSWYYGLSQADFKTMMIAQAGRCAACLDTLGEGRSRAIDHDHKCCPGRRSCGRCVRGILCRNCNSTLTITMDSTRLRALIVYLDRWQENRPERTA